MKDKTTRENNLSTERPEADEQTFSFQTGFSHGSEQLSLMRFKEIYDLVKKELELDKLTHSEERKKLREKREDLLSNGYVFYCTGRPEQSDVEKLTSVFQLYNQWGSHTPQDVIALLHGLNYCSAWDVSGVITQVRKGIQRSQVDQVAAIADLTDKEMAPVLNMSIRNLHHKKTDDLLPIDSSERLLLFEDLLRHGLRVFDGNKDQLRNWLHTPLAELAIREEPLPEESILPTRSMGSFQGPYDLTQLSEQDRKRTNRVPVPKPQTPLQVLDTFSGFKLVDNVLGRAETGVFS